MTVGEQIRNIRKAKGWTQKRLGEACGIAEPTIRRYELGKLNPKIETLQKIAKALDVSTFELEDNLMDKVNKYLLENYSSVKGKISPIYMIDLMDKLSQPTQENSQTSTNETDRNRMLSAFDIMNEKGQKKAADNVEDLSKVPEYQKEENPNVTKKDNS